MDNAKDSVGDPVNFGESLGIALRKMVKQIYHTVRVLDDEIASRKSLERRLEAEIASRNANILLFAELRKLNLGQERIAVLLAEEACRRNPENILAELQELNRKMVPVVSYIEEEARRRHNPTPLVTPEQLNGLQDSILNRNKAREDQPAPPKT